MGVLHRPKPIALAKWACRRNVLFQVRIDLRTDIDGNLLGLCALVQQPMQLRMWFRDTSSFKFLDCEKVPICKCESVFLP